MACTACLFVSLSGCAVSSRVVAGFGAMADSGSCGAVETIIAVAIDGVLATAILLGEELSDFDKVALGALGADAAIGGVMAIQDCVGD